jgi:hypothetical protein
MQPGGGSGSRDIRASGVSAACIEAACSLGLEVLLGLLHCGASMNVRMRKRYQAYVCAVMFLQ